MLVVLCIWIIVDVGIMVFFVGLVIVGGFVVVFMKGILLLRFFFFVIFGYGRNGVFGVVWSFVVMSMFDVVLVMVGYVVW